MHTSENTEDQGVKGMAAALVKSLFFILHVSHTVKDSLNTIFELGGRQGPSPWGVNRAKQKLKKERIVADGCGREGMSHHVPPLRLTEKRHIMPIEIIIHYYIQYAILWLLLNTSTNTPEKRKSKSEQKTSRLQLRVAMKRTESRLVTK